jgi:hypothetical protein
MYVHTDMLCSLCLFRIASSFLESLVTPDAGDVDTRTTRRRRFANHVKDGQKEMLRRLLLSCS